MNTAHFHSLSSIRNGGEGWGEEALGFRNSPLPNPLPARASRGEGIKWVAELDAEAAQMEAVRALLPRFEAKIQRVLDRVWSNPPEVEN
jgi:hypothetical protein